MTLPDDYLLAHTVHEPLTAGPDAPTVVIGSSIGTTSRVWSREVRALRAEFRVITYEHPGHGGDVAGVPSSSGAVPAPKGPDTIAELARAVLRTIDRYDVSRPTCSADDLRRITAPTLLMAGAVDPAYRWPACG